MNGKKMPSVTNKQSHSDPVYLDNAAALPVRESYLKAFTEYCLRYPGNQESMAFHGSGAAAAVRGGKEKILSALQISGRDHTVHFCNSGTEGLSASVQALCMTLYGSFPAGSRIVTTSLEHPALLRALERACREYGFCLTYCSASRYGIEMETLESLLTPETAAVALHHVESQTGSVLDLKRLRRAMDQLAPRALLLADTVQSAGKLPLDLRAVRPDLFLISGQKLAVPSSCAVICRSAVGKNMDLLRNREHFYGRSTPGAILTLADALEEQIREQVETYAHVSMLGTLLDSELKKHSLPFTRTLPMEKSSPFIAHYMCTPYQGAILTRSLYQYGISTAPGSACESETPSGSGVLAAMGFPKQECFCGLRISFSRDNTPEEIRIAAEKLACCVADY